MSRTAGRSAERGARRRHPSARSPVRSDVLRELVADSLGLQGASCPEVGAAILEIRGRSGLDRHEFARRAGVDGEVLAEAEAGRLRREELPGCLRRMVPRCPS